MIDQRSDEDRIRGVIPIRWAGEVREIRTLKRGAAREWRRRLVETLGEIGGLGIDSVDGIGAIGDTVIDRMADLVTAYDREGVLGAPEWIDENVTDEEIYLAFRAILAVVFPFVSDLRALVREARNLGIGNSTSTASTSSRSRSGGSTPRRSTSG